MVSRAERSSLADWWFTVDKLLLASFLVLIFGGLVLSLAASPAVAERIGIEGDSYYFVKRQAIFAIPAIMVLFGVSFFSPRQIRRIALVGFAVCVALLILTLFVGPEVKGSRRWLNFAGVSLQPSEFVKPMFAVLCAFLLAEQQKRPDLPGKLFAFLLLGIVVALLVAQPDIGQTMLVTLTWAGLMFLAGMSWVWIVGIAGVGAGGIVALYSMVPHVQSRVDRFLDPEAGDTYQVTVAEHAFVNGSWWGQGPGEGTYKRILPDSHTDFVYAVLGEEFGLVMCMLLAAVFAFTVMRALSHALRENDSYVRLATAGLTILFGLQSCINMAVNLHLMPAKGMTLPFISYGGSSLVAMGLSSGMLLALTRRRAEQTRFVSPIQFEPLSGRNLTAMGEAKRTVLIAAGGTGGHLFPAEALAHELGARGVTVHLATDHRATTYGRDFPAEAVHVIASATVASRAPLELARSGFALARGMVQSFSLVNRLRPAAVVGFGGYPTIPPLFAAVSRRVPTVVHEANAVAGRANRFLASRVTAVATSFERTGLLGEAAAKAVLTGNPVRPRVVAAARPFTAPAPDEPFNLVVFGGSQGARVFADLMPPAVERLDPALRARLAIVQQARPEDAARVRDAYAAVGVSAVVEPFFGDLPARIADAHLVVCRSGASSVSELAVIGRPSILVPLPHAIDNDQKTNALALEAAGGAVMAEQAGLTPDRLAGLVAELAGDPGRLAAMAEAARRAGRPDAVKRLADLVLAVADGRSPIKTTGPATP